VGESGESWDALPVKPLSGLPPPTQIVRRPTPVPPFGQPLRASTTLAEARAVKMVERVFIVV
jgi:hypothetical protein